MPKISVMLVWKCAPDSHKHPYPKRVALKNVGPNRLTSALRMVMARASYVICFEIPEVTMTVTVKSHLTVIQLKLKCVELEA